MPTPGLLETIRSDCEANKDNKKWLVILVLFRLAHCHLTAPVYLKPLTFICVVIYRIATEILAGAEIHWCCEIGSGARIFHGFGLVINSGVRIGRNVTLRQGTTIGTKETKDGESGSPVLGDNVDVGASAIIIGKVTIGHNAVIGAGAVVTHDVTPMAVVVGNPARILRMNSQV